MHTCIGGDIQERGAKPDPIWIELIEKKLLVILDPLESSMSKAQELHIFHLEQKNKSKRTQEMAQIYPLSAWQLQLNFTWNLI